MKRLITHRITLVVATLLAGIGVGIGIMFGTVVDSKNSKIDSADARIDQLETENRNLNDVMETQGERLDVLEARQPLSISGEETGYDPVDDVVLTEVAPDPDPFWDGAIASGTVTNNGVETADYDITIEFLVDDERVGTDFAFAQVVRPGQTVQWATSGLEPDYTEGIEAVVIQVERWPTP
jgi:hypothetical protein